MNDSNFYVGVVENRFDYLKLGRVQVRIVGLHSVDKRELPTSKLPWASVIQNGTGFAPIEGQTVVVQFFDYPENQMPVVMGVIPKIPQRKSIYVGALSEDPRVKTKAAPMGARDVTSREGANAQPGTKEGSDQAKTQDMKNAVVGAVSSDSGKSTPSLQDSASKITAHAGVDNAGEVIKNGTGGVIELNNGGALSNKMNNAGSFIGQTSQLANNACLNGAKVANQLISAIDSEVSTASKAASKIAGDNLFSMVSDVGAKLKKVKQNGGFFDLNAITSQSSSIVANVVGQASGAITNELISSLSATGIPGIAKGVAAAGLVIGKDIAVGAANELTRDIASKVTGKISTKTLGKISQVNNLVDNVLFGDASSAVNAIATVTGTKKQLDKISSKVNKVTNFVSNNTITKSTLDAAADFMRSGGDATAAANAFKNGILNSVSDSIVKSTIDKVVQKNISNNIIGGIVSGVTTNTITSALANARAFNMGNLSDIMSNCNFDLPDVSSIELSSIASEIMNSTAQTAIKLANDVADMVVDGINDLQNAAMGVINQITDVASSIGNLASAVGSIISGETPSIETVKEALPKGSAAAILASKPPTEIKAVMENPKESAKALATGGATSSVAVASDAGGVAKAVKQQNEARQKVEASNDAASASNTSVQKTFKDEKGKTTANEGSTTNLSGANGAGENSTPTRAIPRPIVKQDSTGGVERKPSTKTLEGADASKVAKLIKVAEECGIKTTEAQATYIAIINALNKGLDATYERYDFPTSELIAYFPNSFGNNVAFAEEYSYGKKAPNIFFQYVYDPSKDGHLLGNRTPNDSFLYCGYGYIKLTGRNEYVSYAQLLESMGFSEDATKLKNEGHCALIRDENLSMKISAYKFLNMTKHIKASAHPHFFYSACSTFGVNKDDAEDMYVNLYGASTQENNGVANRIAGTSINSNFMGYQKASEDDSSLYGFIDPNGKYPSYDESFRPSLSKMALGIINNSAVSLKENNRTIGVPLPFDQGCWDQPHSSYNGRYPYNHVTEFEGPTLFEMDETPGHERINLWHMSGTFSEIDKSGTKVNRIVGDNYEIVDRNGFISISGSCNVTINGDANVYCRSNANVEAEGSIKLKSGGDLNVQVANDMTLNVGGSFKLQAMGNTAIQSAQDTHFLAGNDLYMASSKDMHISSGDTFTTDPDEYDKTIEAHREEGVGKMFINCTNDLHIRSTYETYNEVFGHEHTIVHRDTFETHEGITQHNYAKIVNEELGDCRKVNIARNDYLEAQGTIAITSPSNTTTIKAKKLDLNPSSKPEAPEMPEHPEDITVALVSTPAVKAMRYAMMAPSRGNPLNVKMPPIFIEEPTSESVYELEDNIGTEYSSTSSSVSSGTTPSGDHEAVNEPRAIPPSSLEKLSEIKGSAIFVNGIDPETKTKVSTKPISESKNLIESFDVVNANLKVSDHFVLNDFFDGGFNNRHKLRESGQCNLTGVEIVNNIITLAENVLEPLIDAGLLDPTKKGKVWKINSGFRSVSSNVNATHSDHPKGRAIDLKLIGGSYKTHYDMICKIARTINFHQLILEFNEHGNAWIHIGYRKDENKNNGCRVMVLQYNPASGKYVSRKVCEGYVVINT